MNIYCPPDMVSTLVHAASHVNDMCRVWLKDGCEVTVVDWQACTDSIFDSIEEKLEASQEASLPWNVFATSYVWAPMYTFLLSAYKDQVHISKGQWSQITFAVSSPFSRFDSVGRSSSPAELLEQLKSERPYYGC